MKRLDTDLQKMQPETIAESFKVVQQGLEVKFRVKLLLLLHITSELLTQEASNQLAEKIKAEEFILLPEVYTSVQEKLYYDFLKSYARFVSIRLNRSSEMEAVYCKAVRSHELSKIICEQQGGLSLIEETLHHFETLLPVLKLLMRLGCYFRLEESREGIENSFICALLWDIMVLYSFLREVALGLLKGFFIAEEDQFALDVYKIYSGMIYASRDLRPVIDFFADHIEDFELPSPEIYRVEIELNRKVERRVKQLRDGINNKEKMQKNFKCTFLKGASLPVYEHRMEENRAEVLTRGILQEGKFKVVEREMQLEEESRIVGKKNRVYIRHKTGRRNTGDSL